MLLFHPNLSVRVVLVVGLHSISRDMGPWIELIWGGTLWPLAGGVRVGARTPATATRCRPCTVLTGNPFVNQYQGDKLHLNPLLLNGIRDMK